MKRNIFYLPILIILLFIFVPASVYGLYMHKTSAGADNNKNKELVFKDKNGSVIGKYSCITDICFEVLSGVDDEFLKVNKTDNRLVGILNEKYVFVSDGIIKLYDLLSNKVIEEFTLAKTYGYLATSVIVMNSDNKYGVYDLKQLKYSIEPKYDFIGTINNNDTELDLSKLVVKSDNTWYLIDNNENKISSVFASPIYDYDDNYVITVNNGIYNIYSLSGTEYYSEIVKKGIIINGTYIMYVDEYNNVFVYENGYLVGEYQSVEEPVLEKNKDGVELFNNETLVASFGVN